MVVVHPMHHGDQTAVPRTKEAPKADLVKRLNLRLSASEHKEIRREALERDMSAQEFARDAILRVLRRSGREASKPEPAATT
jgi:hypothetical protein